MSDDNRPHVLDDHYEASWPLDSVDDSPDIPRLEDPDTSPQSFQEMAQRFAAELVGLVVLKQRGYGPSNVLDQGIDGTAKRVREKMARILNNPGVAEVALEEFMDAAGVAFCGWAMAAGYWRRDEVCPPLLPERG